MPIVPHLLTSFDVGGQQGDSYDPLAVWEIYKKAEAIIERRFGAPDTLPNTQNFLVTAVRRFLRYGTLPYTYRSTATIDPDYAKLLEALEVIVSVVPTINAGNIEVLQQIRHAGIDPVVFGFEKNIIDLDRLLILAQKQLESRTKKRLRSSDPRSDWHQTARLLATTIEKDLTRSGANLPSRNSRSSPLVIAVSEFLALLGRTENEDAIRKVLSRAPRSTVGKPPAD